MVDHSNSPFLNGEISKAVNLALPAQRTKGVGMPLTRAQGNTLLLSSYKGGVSRKNSALPLQAKKASARLDRVKGKTKTPFGRPS